MIGAIATAALGLATGAGTAAATGAAATYGRGRLTPGALTLKPAVAAGFGVTGLGGSGVGNVPKPLEPGVPLKVAVSAWEPAVKVAVVSVATAGVPLSEAVPSSVVPS